MDRRSGGAPKDKSPSLPQRPGGGGGSALIRLPTGKISLAPCPYSSSLPPIGNLKDLSDRAREVFARRRRFGRGHPADPETPPAPGLEPADASLRRARSSAVGAGDFGAVGPGRDSPWPPTRARRASPTRAAGWWPKPSPEPAGDPDPRPLGPAGGPGRVGASLGADSRF